MHQHHRQSVRPSVGGRKVQFPWHFPQMIYAMTILQPRFYPHISSSRPSRPIPIYSNLSPRFPIAIKYSRGPSRSIGLLVQHSTHVYLCTWVWRDQMSSPFLPNVRFINNERDQNFPSSGGFASECPPPARRARAARFPPRPSFASGDSYDLRPTLIGDSDRHISTVLFFFCLPVPTDDRPTSSPSHLHFDHARAARPEEISR